MKGLKFHSIFLFLLVSSYAWGGDSLGVRYIQGKPFVEFQIEKGDTEYSISNSFGVSQETLRFYNQSIEQGLKEKQVILVPCASSKPTIHKVVAGETLFSLYRQYGTSIEDLKKLNNLGSNELSIGQELIVLPAWDPDSERIDLISETTHRVEKGETLFSISKVYGLKWQDLQEMNNLESTELSVGQVLIVQKDSALTYAPLAVDSIKTDTIYKVKKGETLYTISKDFGKTPEEIMKYNELESATVKEGQVLRLIPPVLGDSSSRNIEPIVKTHEEYMNGEKAIEEVSIGNVTKIIERGICELIEGGEDTYKYLGLHKALPRGTIVQVKNAENDRSVFIRVIGSIPDIDSNNQLVLKVSPRAFEALGAVNKRFKVEISYIPDSSGD